MGSNNHLFGQLQQPLPRYKGYTGNETETISVDVDSKDLIISANLTAKVKDKLDSAVQPSDLAEYAKTKDVVTNIEAGQDITVRPEDNGSIEIGHEAYQTGTIKASEDIEEPNFITSVTINNGHFESATFQTITSALESITFVFDGGNSTN